LYGDPGQAESYVGTPTSGLLYSGELLPAGGGSGSTGYSVQVEGFRWYMVDLRGGVDVVAFWDRPDGKDYLVGMPGFCRFSSGVFYHSVKGFQEVQATSGGGGDGAYLYDDPQASDVAVSGAQESSLTIGGRPCERLGFLGWT